MLQHLNIFVIIIRDRIKFVEKNTTKTIGMSWKINTSVVFNNTILFSENIFFLE